MKGSFSLKELNKVEYKKLIKSGFVLRHRAIPTAHHRYYYINEGDYAAYLKYLEKRNEE